MQNSPEPLKRRLRRPLVLVFFAAAAAAIVPAAGWLPFNQNDSKAYRNKIREQLSRVILMNLAAMENLTYQFIANGELNRMLKAYTETSELYQIAPWNRTFSAFLESHEGANPILRDAAFFDRRMPGRKPLTMSDNLDTETLQRLRTSDFFRKTAEGDGKTVWFDSGLLRHDGRYSLLCGRTIPDASGRNQLGVLILFIRAERLAEVINGELYLDGEPDEASVNGYFNLLVGRNGTILASPVKSQQGRSLSEIFENVSDLKGLLGGGKRSGESSLGWKKNALSASFSGLGKTDIFLIETSAEAYGKRSYVFGWVLLPFAFVLLSVILVRRVLTADRGERPYPETGEASSGKPLWVENLPPRELEILLLVTEGKSNKEIAYALSLKEQTVKNYIRSTYEKLGVHDRVSATLLVNRAGFKAAESPSTAPETKNSSS